MRKLDKNIIIKADYWSVFFISKKATNGDWTRDLILTMDALYQLSYRGL